MKIFKPVFLVFPFLIFGCVSSKIRVPQSDESFHLTQLPYDAGVPLVGSVELRTGLLYESANVPFKGCVMYLEGLGDSILNHRPLFTALSEGGFRVITFDYMGQGGSTGSMNHTRIYDPVFSELEIGTLARTVWEKFGHQQTLNGNNCERHKKMVIGWSTGGLATYRLALEGWADSVVLIAPGIHPKEFVGEAAENRLLLVKGEQVITERTLTRNKFVNQQNPHIDPINPVTPVYVAAFAANLLATSKLSQTWKIPTATKGLVFLSGDEDTYVDRAATKGTLARNAPHFVVVEYAGALHEIDNELPEVANDMTNRTVEFFSR